MKSGIHPEWHQAKIICTCGNTFTAGSTLPQIQVDICSHCHPFYTGQQKFIDTQGQVEKFTKRQSVSEVRKTERVKIAAERQSKEQQAKAEKPSLKELLLRARRKATS